jgi:hypothetical protein
VTSTAHDRVVAWRAPPTGHFLQSGTSEAAKLCVLCVCVCVCALTFFVSMSSRASAAARLAAADLAAFDCFGSCVVRGRRVMLRSRVRYEDRQTLANVEKATAGVLSTASILRHAHQSNTRLLGTETSSPCLLLRVSCPVERGRARPCAGRVRVDQANVCQSRAHHRNANNKYKSPITDHASKETNRKWIRRTGCRGAASREPSINAWIVDPLCFHRLGECGVGECVGWVWVSVGHAGQVGHRIGQ